MNDRLKQLRLALAEVQGDRHESLAGALQRTLRLLELCPWLQEGDPPKNVKLANGKVVPAPKAKP